MLESVSDLLTSFRRLADDEGIDSLWSDAELIEYADEAHREFARETLCFPDSTTFAPAVTTGDPWVKLDPRIIKVRHAILASRRGVVSRKTLDELAEILSCSDYGQQQAYDWEVDTGTPRYLVTDLDPARGRLVPIPVEDDTLSLTVYREPKYSFTSISDLIEIPDKFRRSLLYGMMARAAEKQDIDAFGMSSATDFQLRWERDLVEAYAFFRRKMRPAGTTGYGGI